MNKNNNQIPSIIMGLAFSLFGIVPLIFFACKGVLNKTPVLAIILFSIFAVAGIELFVFSIIKLNKSIKFEKAIKQGADKNTLFLLEDDIKKFQRIEIEIMTTPVPFILLVAIICTFVYHFKKSNLGMGKMILFVLATAFLLFICVGLIYNIFFKKSIKQTDSKLKEEKLIGKIEKIYLAPIVKYNNNNVSIEDYQLLISYYYDGKKHEFLTSNTYSKSQILYMNKFEFVPLLLKNGIINIDRNEFSHIQKIRESIDIDFDNIEKSPNNIDDNEFENAKRYYTKGIPSINSIENKRKIEKIVKLIFYFAIPIFSTIFIGLALFAMIWSIKEKSDTVFTVVCTSIMILFGLSLYVVCIKMIISDIYAKQCKKYGENTFAQEFNLIAINSSHESGNYNRLDYVVKYTYLDKNQKKHKKSENILVSPFFFTEYNIKKLPIKIYKTFAMLDYEELIRIAKSNI